MPLLSTDTLHNVVNAVVSAALDWEALTANLTPDVRGTLSKAEGRSLKAHLFCSLSHLNSTSWDREGTGGPLKEVLKTAAFLAGPRREERVFREALAEMEEGQTATTDPNEVALLNVYVKRAKRFYKACGFEVAPVETDRSPNFLAFRDLATVLVIAVAVGPVEVAIAGVQHSVKRLRANGMRVSGIVVLVAAASEAKDGVAGAEEEAEARVQEEARTREAETKVCNAGLEPYLIGDLQPMGFSEIEALVRAQLASLAADQEASAPGEPGGVEVEVRRFLRDSGARVLVVERTHAHAANVARTQIACACGAEFLAPMDVPAPLVLPLLGTTAEALNGAVGDVFRRHGVRCSSAVLPSLLEKGAFLPIFCDVSGDLSSDGSRALGMVEGALIGRTKVVLIFAAPAPMRGAVIARRLQLPLTSIHFLAAT